MKQKIINGILALVSLGLTIMYVSSLLGRSTGGGSRAEAANTTQYILIGLFGILTIVFASKIFRKPKK